MDTGVLAAVKRWRVVGVGALLVLAAAVAVPLGADGALEDAAGSLSMAVGSGEVISLDPAITMNSAGQTQLFVRNGTDKQIYTRADRGSEWGAWENLGGPNRPSGPGVSGADNVVVVGRDGVLYHNKRTNGTWSGFRAVDGGGHKFQGRPAIIVRAEGTSYWALGTDGHVWVRAGSGWEDWGSPEGRPAQDVGLSAIDQTFTYTWVAGTNIQQTAGVILNVAVVGADGGIWLRQQVHSIGGPTGAFTGWRNLGGGSDNAPALAIHNNTGAGSNLAVVHTGRNKIAYLCLGTPNTLVGSTGPVDNSWRCSDWMDLGSVNFQDAPSAYGSPTHLMVAEKSNGASVLFRSLSMLGQVSPSWVPNP